MKPANPYSSPQAEGSPPAPPVPRRNPLATCGLVTVAAASALAAGVITVYVLHEVYRVISVSTDSLMFYYVCAGLLTLLGGALCTLALIWRPRRRGLWGMALAALNVGALLYMIYDSIGRMP